MESDVPSHFNYHQGRIATARTRAIVANEAPERSPPLNAACASGPPKEMDQASTVLEAAFKLTSAGLVQTDLTGQVLLANDSCCRVVGRSRGELSRWQDLVHPDDLPAAASSFRRCVDEDANFALEVRYVRPAGSPRWVRTSGALVRDTEGHPNSVLMTLCDVTEHHRAEDDLIDADRRKD